MAKTIVGLYEDRTTAHRVVAALKDAGFTKDHVQFASNEPGEPGEFEGDAASFRSTDTLTGYGVAPDEATFYAEGLRGGGSLVVVRARDADTDTAVDLMAEHDPVRYEDRAADDASTDAAAPFTSADETTAAFQEKTIEVVAHAEEAVVEKTAHVTGEVTVGLDASERQQTVGGTVRSTHVEADETGGDMDDEAHFASAYGTSGRSYDQMRPAYDYGRSARSAHPDGDFAASEATMRSDYESRHGADGGSAWETVRDAVRHGFGTARRAGS